MSNKPKGAKGLEQVQQDVYVKQMRDRLVVLRLEHELAKLTVEKVQYEEWLMKKFPQKGDPNTAKTTEGAPNTQPESQDNTPGTDVDNKEA